MAAKKPTHYAIVLKRPFPVPGTALVIAAGESVTSAEIVAAIPADLIDDKKPAEA